MGQGAGGVSAKESPGLAMKHSCIAAFDGLLWRGPAPILGAPAGRVTSLVVDRE